MHSNITAPAAPTHADMRAIRRAIRSARSEIRAILAGRRWQPQQLEDLEGDLAQALEDARTMPEAAELEPAPQIGARRVDCDAWIARQLARRLEAARAEP